ncbi:sulfite exporter TauE/SafE family protein [Yoonia sp. R2331]|uniref:sulfite exporter TauE/SafE family protein n=1 Tax=Yoonia sp. R2331 TaxID=3237238 RepID=UPI0034E5D6B9
MEDIGFWIAATLAAICVGLGKGGVPVITAMAVPLLALVTSPVAAAGILLPVFVASDIFGLYAYWRSFHRAVLAIMLVALPLGTLIGWLTVDYVSEAAVTLIVGLIGGVYALTLLIRRNLEGPARKPRWGPGLFWGTITGFTSFVSHSGAAPFQIFALPLRMPKLMFAGTVTVAFAYVNVIKLIPYYFLGQLNPGNLQIAAILALPAICAVFAGVWLVRILPEKLFFQAVVWALLLLSIRLIWGGLSGL